MDTIIISRAYFLGKLINYGIITFYQNPHWSANTAMRIIIITSAPSSIYQILASTFAAFGSELPAAHSKKSLVASAHS